MYGSYINNPFMMSNIPYNQMLNTGLRMSSIPQTMTRASGLRSLLGLGGARNILPTRSINWSSLLNNTSKTIGVVKEAIPIVKEVKPMFNNMRSMLKVASIFKDETDNTNINQPENENIKNTTTTNNNGMFNNQNEPNFFL